MGGGRGILLLSFLVHFQMIAKRLLRNQISALSRQVGGETIARHTFLVVFCNFGCLFAFPDFDVLMK